jgi:hypothetical protein
MASRPELISNRAPVREEVDVYPTTYGVSTCGAERLLLIILCKSSQLLAIIIPFRLITHQIRTARIGQAE